MPARATRNPCLRCPHKFSLPDRMLTKKQQLDARQIRNDGKLTEQHRRPIIAMLTEAQNLAKEEK